MIEGLDRLLVQAAAYRNYHPYMFPRDLSPLFLEISTLRRIQCAIMIVIMPHKPADFEACKDCRTNLDDAKEGIKVESLARLG